MLQGGIDLLFYGDSLTELWRGTAWGYNSRLGGGIPAVFSRYFGQYRSVVCGSGGARIILFHMFSSSKYGLAWVQNASEVIAQLSRHAASAILAYRPGTYLANWMVKSLCVCCPDCLDVLAGDTTANLWWRIQNGELPRNHQPKLAVVMIGANDLTAAYVQCGTWDQSSYYNAAANIAQQCVLSA